MWYEILPSMGIIAACIGAPQIFIYYNNKFLNNGNPNRRPLTTEMQRRQYLRDTRLTGNPYIIAGLEALPDEGEVSN